MAVSKPKKKFYAVLVGHKPGIFTSWTGPGGAQEQVAGYPNAQYKGFVTRAEAEAWLENPSSPAPKKKEKKKDDRKTTGDTGSTPASKKDVVIYTDGGCINNPGPGGYGAVLMHKGKRKEISGGFRKTTNNRMELLACIEALKLLKYPCTVDLYSDSQYVVNGITKGWAKRWRAKKWMRNKEQKAENADMWEQLLELCDTHDVKFNWVRGHAGNRENERCDQLANGAAREPGIKEKDINYETGNTTK